MIEITQDAHCAHIRLNQPARSNALSAELVEALLEGVTGAIESGARVLVLSGEGRSFCGGFDLSTLADETDASLVYRFLRIEQLLQTLYYAPCYTVALAHGPVSGAGADLVAVCARRIAAPDVSFRFPGARFGVVLGTERLIQLVGPRGRSLVLEQQKIDAQEAARINLVDNLATPEDWDAEIVQIMQGATTVTAAVTQQIMQLKQSEGMRDLGNLASSIINPGLKARMQTYWNEVTAAHRQAKQDRK